MKRLLAIACALFAYSASAQQFEMTIRLVSPTATSNAPSWLVSGSFNGWWDSNICRVVEFSWPTTNGSYVVQFAEWPNPPAWLNLTLPLDGSVTNQVTVQLTVPKIVGYFRTVKTR